jgi:hypothetical protein
MGSAWNLVVHLHPQGSADRDVEHGCGFPIVETVGELVDVLRQVPHGNPMELTDHAALNQRPKGFDGVGMAQAVDVPRLVVVS